MFTLSSAPEPSPFAALGLGVLGLIALALKARRRAA
jgi:MYXO-CTERM domain-containing protein